MTHEADGGSGSNPSSLSNAHRYKAEEEVVTEQEQWQNDQAEKARRALGATRKQRKVGDDG